MNLLSRRVHAVLDYVFGLIVAASPWIFGFSDAYLATEVATTIGGLTIFYSLVTNYELGVIHLIPFSGHLFFDLIMGIALLGAPWHFAMGGKAGAIFSLLGVFAIAVMFLTERPRATANTAT